MLLCFVIFIRQQFTNIVVSYVDEYYKKAFSRTLCKGTAFSPYHKIFSTFFVQKSLSENFALSLNLRTFANKNPKTMQILTIITLVLLVVVTIVFSVLLHKCLVRIDDFEEESKLNKSLASDAIVRSMANFTVIAQFQHAHDILDGEFHESCSKKQSEQHKQVSERRALYKELRATHSIKETANLMDISETTARRYEKWINGTGSK